MIQQIGIERADYLGLIVFPNSKYKAFILLPKTKRFCSYHCTTCNQTFAFGSINIVPLENDCQQLNQLWGDPNLDSNEYLWCPKLY